MALNRRFTGQTSVSGQPVKTKPAALQPCSLEHPEGMRSGVAVSIMTLTAIKEKTKWSLLLIQQGINDNWVASAGQHRVVLMTFLSLTASREQKDIAGLGPT